MWNAFLSLQCAEVSDNAQSFGGKTFDVPSVMTVESKQNGKIARTMSIDKAILVTKVAKVKP